MQYEFQSISYPWKMFDDKITNLFCKWQQCIMKCKQAWWWLLSMSTSVVRISTEIPGSALVSYGPNFGLFPEDGSRCVIRMWWDDRQSKRPRDDCTNFKKIYFRFRMNNFTIINLILHFVHDILCILFLTWLRCDKWFTIHKIFLIVINALKISNSRKLPLYHPLNTYNPVWKAGQYSVANPANIDIDTESQ